VNKIKKTSATLFHLLFHLKCFSNTLYRIILQVYWTFYHCHATKCLTLCCNLHCLHYITMRESLWMAHCSSIFSFLHICVHGGILTCSAQRYLWAEPCHLPSVIGWDVILSTLWLVDRTMISSSQDCDWLIGSWSHAIQTVIG
jgi:hypothetical protein